MSTSKYLDQPLTRYSPRSQSTYRAVVRGTSYGPATSALLTSPEAWNLAYLSHDFESTLMHPDPCFTTNIHRTVQTALDGSGEDITGAKDSTGLVRGILLLPAPRVVHILLNHPILHSLPAYIAYGQKWIDTIQIRSRLCRFDQRDGDDIGDLSEARTYLSRFFTA